MFVVLVAEEVIPVIRLGLIAAQASHLELLQNAFQADPEFQITELTQPSAPDVLVVDVADQPVRQPQFWITLHGFYPTATLMGVLEVPIDLTALQAALQAGAQYLATWAEPTDHWRAAARAAFHRAGSLFQGEIQVAVWALMDDWAAHEPRRIHIGALELDLLRGQAILAGQPLSPKWSPDGQKIVFSCFTQDHHDIFVVSYDGSQITNLTNGEGSNTNPSWSPDGREIAFVSNRGGLGEIVGWEDTVRSNAIFLMNADGSNIRRLTTRDDEHILWYAWLPSSRADK